MTSHSKANKSARMRPAVITLGTLMSLVISFCSLASPALASSNPVPLISSVSPLSATPGGGDFTLTVRGTGFVNGTSKIYWNGAALAGTTTCATSDVCAVTVPGADIGTQGTAIVTVVDPAQTGAVSNQVIFPIIGATAAVGLKNTNVPAGNGPSSVAIADFNGDGILDAAVVNKGDNTVSVLLGDGHGNFTLHATVPTGISPVSIATGDFNNDGHLDLAVVNACGVTLSCTSSTTGSVSILLGDGTGTFTAGPSSPATGASPTFIAAGDFNGDGALDLAVADGGDNNVAILLNDGAGNFSRVVDIFNHLGTDPNPNWIAVGDFNNDGILDLAIANLGAVTSRGTTVSVKLGAGTGLFSGGSVSSQGLSPTAVAVGDFNGDGILDLAVANSCGTDTSCASAGRVAILEGDGAGNFGTLLSNSTAGSGPSALVLADLNGDGKLDAAVADGTGSQVSILLGDGTGNLTLQTSPSSPSTGTSPGFIAVGDFNGDGGLDIVTTNKGSANLSVLLQTSTISLACGAGDGTGCSITTTPNIAANLSFGSEPVGSTTSPLSVIYTNTSNIQLTINSISVSSGASNFQLATGTCSGVLSPGSSCTINAVFAPGSQGGLGGLIQIADTAAASPHNINIKGTGTAAAATISPATLVFGNVSIPGPSPAQLVTLSNTGSLTLNITSVSATSPFAAQPTGTDGTTCGATLAANSTCQIAVTFNPSAAQFESGTLSVMDSTGAQTLTQSVGLSGTGIQAVASASPGSLTFTNQTFGSTSVAEPVTISNSGGGTLSSINVSISGANAGEFSQSNNCGTSVPGYGNCTIYVTFTPSVTGTPQSATLSVTDNAGTQSVVLAGTGAKANTLSMVTTTTPNPSMVGLMVTVSFTVTATPPGIGTPTGTVTVNDGTGDSCTGVLSGGAGSCSMPTLTPSTPGPKPVTATYNGDANFNTSVSAAVPQTVIKANTTTSITSVLPTSLVVGQPVTVKFTVAPPAGDILTPSGSVTVSDGVGDSCTGTLTAGSGNCSLIPTTPGTKTLTATYSGDTNFNSSSISLNNAVTVVDFSVVLSPATETISSGHTATYTLTITPLGGFTGIVGLTCTDNQPSTTCTLSQSSVVVGGAVDINVTVFAAKNAAHGTFTLTFTGKYGSGNPPTGGLTHSSPAYLTIK